MATYLPTLPCLTVSLAPLRYFLVGPLVFTGCSGNVHHGSPTVSFRVKGTAFHCFSPRGALASLLVNLAYTSENYPFKNKYSLQ